MMTAEIRQKANEARSHKMRIKGLAFAREYVKSGFNGTKAVKALYNPKNEHTANSMATEVLRKPVVQNAILQEMEKQGMTNEYLISHHKSVVAQSEHLPSKNSAIDMAYKLKGVYAPDKQLNVNIDVPTDEKGIDIALQEILKELKDLKGTS